MDEEKNEGEKNQLFEEGKKQTKKAIMKKLMPIIIKVCSIMLIVLMAGVLILGVFNAVGEVVQGIINGIVDFFTIDGDGAIAISDEQIDTIINSIDELGVSIDGLKLMGDVDYSNPDMQEENTEALRKYIKEFYEAQAMTQTINTAPSWLEENIKNSDKPYGTIYIHRIGRFEDIEYTDNNQLEYISYEEMNDMIKDNNSHITEYYSIDEEGKLVIAETSEVITEIDEITMSNEKETTLKHIDYKNIVAQYTTPMNYLLYLTMITQNPEFVSKVTDLVKDSEIRLVVFDAENYMETTETYTYTENTKTKEKLEDDEETNINEIDINSINTTAEDDDYKEETTAVTKTTVTKIKTRRIAPSIKVAYAKTWFCEQTIEYIEEEEEPSNIIPTSESIEDEQEPKLIEEGSVSWKTNQIKQYSATTTEIKYKESTRGDVIDRTGEKGDGEESFIGLLDVEFKIPNSSREVAAGGNLISGAEMFFFLLQQDANSQTLEQITRYILYKYTGQDYGVTNFDFSLFDAKDFQAITNTQGLGNYLLQFSDSSKNVPMSANEQYYSMRVDENGWLVIGKTDLLWKLNQSSFSIEGKVWENGEEKNVENIQAFVNNKLSKGAVAQYQEEEVFSYQIYIAKDLVDRIEANKQQAAYDVVLNETNGLNLSRQQIYALTSIIYDFGRLPEKNGYTFREVYNEGAKKYEENSWEHNKFIWDNWWCKLGGDKPIDIYARDAAFETYNKGIFDFSLSDAGEISSRKYYIYYTEEQLEQFSYAPSKAITRTVENEEDIFTLELMEGEFTPADEKYIRGYYTSTTGREFTIINQGLVGYENREYWRLNDPDNGGPGWAGRCNRAACAIIASGYSEQDANELITTMNKMYDSEISSDNYWNLYGLTRAEYKSGYVSAASFEEIIRQQLREGGYVALWVNSNEKGYYGKSGTRWTGNIHWMAIIDYRIKDGEEEIVIADYRGADWYDIDEFISGVSSYALINEK